MFSCQSENQNKTEKLELFDDLGRKVVLGKEVKRVVSIAPSVTEMIGLICKPEQLVGRTPHCNYPLWVSQVPAIDVYPLNIEALVKLKPDLVLVKDGLISTANLEKLQSMGIQVYVQRYTSVQDIFRNARMIGQLTGNIKRGHAVADSLITVRDSLQRTIPEYFHTAMVFIGTNPICVYGQGSFCDDILTLSGFKNLAGRDLRGEFPTTTPEYVLSRNPQVLLGTEYVFKDDQLFNQYNVLKQMNAWKSKNYFILNSDLFSRPGPRIFQSVTELRALRLHE